MSTETVTDRQALTGDFTIDTAHSRIGFVARHAMVTKVRGHFADFAGTAHFDAEEPSRSTAEVTISVKSIDTNQAQRDEHLRANDFFDAPTYPEITFSSTRVEAAGAGEYRMTGDLTIKGVTKPVVIDWQPTGTAIDPYGNLRAGFEGRAVVNRSDFGVSWNSALETGGVLVSDKIILEFDISAISNT